MNHSPFQRKSAQRRNALVATFVLVLVLATSHAGWNLPYTQPAAYDYSAYYSQSVNDYLDIVPELFEGELAKGWSYFKANFIISNGLVNHRRLGDGGQVIGENEAVSEGQGYGMLMAVLNNDQTTFNRIFEAANTYMWDSARKSYFTWSWPNGGQGAATDADLDIGLALVFADKLQENDLWQAYSNNGITYRSRALEIIHSIRTNMTQNDYLLPGDNWGGDAINNINPSYFATAWLKVFNAYQSTDDFTPVIDKCYNVLERMPRYSKGQAVDWCTTTGSRAGGQPYGMGNDAIRVPWRIAMDALWFNDPRAIEYCANSRHTLSNYTESNKGLLIKQMGQYTESGSLVPESYMCSEVAMWACAILGSKDKAYATEGLHATILKAIIGSSADFFGSIEMQDNKFYYKQSLAMLGYAAIAGHFPNILADMEGGVEPPEPVVLTEGLSAAPTSVELPGSVSFTATLDRSAAWTITLTGQTSGKTETLDGTGSTVSATWSGSGWYEVETVDATLSVVGLDPQTSSDMLTSTVTITSAPEKPALEPGGTITVHDCENGSTVNPWKGAWYSYTDQSTSGSSTVTPADATDLVVPEVGNPGYGVQATFSVDQYAGVGMTLVKEGSTVDLTNFESVVFDYKTDAGIGTMVFSVGTTNITNYAYNLVSISGTNGQWQTQTVRLADLEPPSWSPTTQKDLSVSSQIQWQVESGNNGTLTIDNVRLTLKPGKLPGDDILALIGAMPTRDSRTYRSTRRPARTAGSAVLYSLDGRTMQRRGTTTHGVYILRPAHAGAVGARRVLIRR